MKVPLWRRRQDEETKKLALDSYLTSLNVE